VAARSPRCPPPLARVETSTPTETSPETGGGAKDMGPAEAVLTGGAPVRVVMTMAMAMAMSVRRKSDVWVY